MIYNQDILNQGLEALCIHQPADYEGDVVCTLVRKKSKTPSAKAVLHLHGFNDYFFNHELAEKFSSHSFNFYALDLRKYGRSWLPHQKLNNVRDLAEYDADIESALNIIVQEGNTELLLSGHSMGGLLALLFAEKNQQHPILKAVFLNSPFFDQDKDPVTKKIMIPIISGLGKIWPDISVPGRFSKFYGPSLHKNDYGEWDYNLQWKPHIMPLANTGWVRAIYRAQRKIHAGIALNLPLLIMHPTKSVGGLRWKESFKSGDIVVNVKDIVRFARKIKGPCKTVAIDGAVHDLTLSAKAVRTKVYEELFDWITGEASFTSK
jgi:alpha-beta hydrolase superfamily lysophospholipase